MFNFASALAMVAISVSASGPVYGNDSYGLGYGYKAEVQPTYGWRKGTGYGIYNEPRRAKTLIANDGYRVKKRTDIYDRTYETVNAKCMLLDPEDEAYIGGTVTLTQGGKDKGTFVWADIWGLDYDQYDLTINALGDLRDGCDSTGAVFNPNVSASGYGYNGSTPPTGKLGNLIRDKAGNASLDETANVDLSGNQSVIGRSMVLTRRAVEGDYHTAGRAAERVACCTIGLSAGKPKVSYGYAAEPAYVAEPYTASYGAGSYGYAASPNNYW